MAFFSRTVRECQQVGFAVFDSQFEGFVDPVLRNGERAD